MTDRRNKLFQDLSKLLFVLVIAILIASCGRKSIPERPVDSDFPRSYPSQ